jgi:hypothetical protein
MLISPVLALAIQLFTANKTAADSQRPESEFNRHSPDDSETSVESSDFAASMEARREMWLATSSSGSPSPFYCVIDGASKL